MAVLIFISTGAPDAGGADFRSSLRQPATGQYQQTDGHDRRVSLGTVFEDFVEDQMLG